MPWQAVRRREAGADPDAPLIMRKEDLRIRRFEERAARVTIFAVDASGSAAAARLAEAKGAVELMLGQAYVTRSEVALVAFRGTSAELILPPTRSLTRARRTLAELPGGGGTPLALGLNVAREVAEAVIARGRSAALVILTDGRANIARDGQPGRAQAMADALASARRLRTLLTLLGMIFGVGAIVAMREGGHLGMDMLVHRLSGKPLFAAVLLAQALGLDATSGVIEACRMC